MKSIEMKIKTPRGTFNIHTIFDTIEEARSDGWGLWFQHENFLILAKENRVGAVVEVNKTSGDSK